MMTNTQPAALAAIDADDRAWFLRNPRRTFRIRRPLPGEFKQYSNETKSSLVIPLAEDCFMRLPLGWSPTAYRVTERQIEKIVEYCLSPKWCPYNDAGIMAKAKFTAMRAH
jgi:hypothetical protein